MNLPIYVEWDLQDGKEANLREGGKHYNLRVMYVGEGNWKSFVNSEYATDENDKPIISNSIEGARNEAIIQVEKLLIEDGIFHKDGYTLVDEYGNPKKI